MELWLVYAIIASVSIGINGFLTKVISDRNIDGAMLTFIQGLVYLLVGLGQSLIFGLKLFSLEDLFIIGLSILIAIIIFLNLRFRIRALKYLSTSEYFIGYRIFTTIILLIVGIIFLSETITGYQIFGLILGSFAIMFLFEEDKKLRTSRNWNRAMIYLLLSIIAGGLIQIIAKVQGIDDFPYSSMLFYQGMVMLSISAIFDRKAVLENIVSIGKNKKTLFITLIACLFVYVAASFNILAYKFGGSVSIVTKIMAYSLFVSIGLSILLGKEKMSYKKGIAFALTIISIYYLN